MIVFLLYWPNSFDSTNKSKMTCEISNKKLLNFELSFVIFICILNYGRKVLWLRSKLQIFFKMFVDDTKLENYLMELCVCFFPFEHLWLRGKQKWIRYNIIYIKKNRIFKWRSFIIFIFVHKSFLTCSQCMHNVLFYIIKLFLALTLLCVFFFLCCCCW